jgi:hypothetical protein
MKYLPESPISDTTLHGTAFSNRIVHSRLQPRYSYTWRELADDLYLLYIREIVSSNEHCRSQTKDAAAAEAVITNRKGNKQIINSPNRLISPYRSPYRRTGQVPRSLR